MIPTDRGRRSSPPGFFVFQLIPIGVVGKSTSTSIPVEELMLHPFRVDQIEFHTAVAKSWWANSTDADRDVLWREMQRGHMHPVTSVMAHMAQIGYLTVQQEMTRARFADPTLHIQVGPDRDATPSP
jgi:hypothetical protein